MIHLSYIKGTYIKEIYSNKENGYIVGVLKLKETDLEINTNSVYFTGNFFNLRLRSAYIMNGEFIEHKKYGNQFHVTTYELVLPTKKKN